MLAKESTERTWISRRNRWGTGCAKIGAMRSLGAGCRQSQWLWRMCAHGPRRQIVALSLPLVWYACRKVESSPVTNFTIEFFRVRLRDEAHATLDRISIIADDLDSATIKAKSLFDTLEMPQKPDGLRILDQVSRELFSWKPDDHDA